MTTLIFKQVNKAAKVITPQLIASPGTVITRAVNTIPPASSLIDPQNNTWTVSNGQVYENGALAGTTSNVVLLLLYNGVIHQENQYGEWWYWNGSAWIWEIGDPRIQRVSVPIDNTYHLVFDEEFNGSAIDTTKWSVPNGTPDTSYSQYNNATYSSANITVANSIATFTVTGTVPNGPFQTSAANTHGNNLFFQYGYVEAYVNLAAGNATTLAGIAAAFWMNAGSPTTFTFPEIDILEWAGNAPTVNNTTWHYAVPNDGGNAVGITHATSGINFPGNWHHVGMLWTASAIIWYVDGTQVFTTSTNVNSSNNNSEALMINAAVGGVGNNLLTTSTILPASHQFAYIHVYQQIPTATLIPQSNYSGPGAINVT